jgi:hypothetical protein
MDTGGGGGTGNFYDLSDIPNILRVVPESVTFSGRIVQWATGATASSQFSTGEYSASRATGSPNTGLSVGANGADSPNAWAEAARDRNKVNNITLTYSNAVYIVIIIVRETLNSGTISKVEVEKDGAFVTVYTRSFATGAQVGGLITGEASGKVTDTTITLNTQLDYKSNKVRISTGDTRNVFNEIDAVRLTGSLGKTVTPRRVDISYSDLEDKPTSPPEITDAQVTSGTGTDEVLPTPAKLKVMIETHSNGITPSFETISSNLMAWDVVARTYTDDPSDASKKVLASVGISDSSDATKVVVITYTWNSNGTIQNEVLSFSNRVFPATVKKTKTYSYTDGRISRIVYT